MDRAATQSPDPDPRDGTKGANISEEHQEQGDAKRPSDTLDRDQAPPEDDGGRKSSFLHNA